MYSIAKKLPSAEVLNELLTVDSSSPSGLTWRVNRRGTAKAGTKAGTVASSGTTGSVMWNVKVNGILCQAHRLIWKMVHGKDPVGVIDHIDGNPLNNNVDNLQDITQAQNLRKKAGEIINA